MSDISRYSEFKYEGGFYNDNVDGDWCKYEDVAPIIQRKDELEKENTVLRARVAELEAELARLREQEPYGYMSKCGFMKKAVFDRMNKSARSRFATPLYAEPKPAQEIPAELVEWANSQTIHETLVHSAKGLQMLRGYESARAFVKSQLDKIKGGV